MRTLHSLGVSIGIAAVLGLAGCGDQLNDSTTESEEETKEEVAVAWADVETVIKDNCVTAGCHGNPVGGLPDWTNLTEANFKAEKDAVIAALKSNTMPQVGSAQAQAWTDAKEATVLNFLE